MTDPLSDFEAQVRQLLQKAEEAVGVAVRVPLETPPAGLADRAVACFPLAKALRKAPRRSPPPSRRL